MNNSSIIPADDTPYRKLQEHLNRQPIGLPPSRTDADIRLLRHIFSPDEARAATCLSHIPEPLDFWDANFQADLDPESCIGCGMCVKKCQTNAMTLETDKEQHIKAVVNQHRCIGCGHCVTSCPVKALTLNPRKHQVQPPDSREALNAILLKKNKRYWHPSR